MDIWEIARYGMMDTDRRKELEELGFRVVNEGKDTLQVTPPSPDWRIERYEVSSEIIDPSGKLRIVDHRRPGGHWRWLEINRD